MLDVFARYEHYGLTSTQPSGVWHILSTPPDIHNPRYLVASSLCVSFRLEQEVLDAAIAQIVAVRPLAGPRLPSPTSDAHWSGVERTLLAYV